MADLISRAAVLNGISDLMKSPWYNDGKGGERHVQFLARKDAVEVVRVLCVEKETAVDAVPVVRCAECKHCFDAGPDPMVPYDGEDVWHCEMWGREASAYQVDPYRFFCARGERRNGVAAAFFATSE